MGQEHLKPITTVEQAREMGRKGGSVSSDAKKYAALVSKSHKAKCKNCPAICIFKKENIAKSQNTRCTVPQARAKAIWHNQPVMSEEVLDKIGSETLLKMMARSNNAKDLKLLHDMVIARKKEDYPKTQQIQVDQRVAVLGYEDLKRIYDEVHTIDVVKEDDVGTKKKRGARKGKN